MTDTAAEKGPARGFGEVEATLEKSGRVEDLIRLYETRSREVPTPDEAAHLLARAGHLARERLKSPPRAEELLRRALVYAPNSREALEGLRAVAEGRNDAAMLADCLERLGMTSSGAAAAAYYLKAGELYETRLARRDRAVLCYQLATRAAPHERAGYQRARAVLLGEGRYGSAYDSLERERSHLGDHELLEDYVAFAEALVTYPQEHTLATKAIVRALSIDGKNARAQQAQKDLGKLEYVWREKVKGLKASSLEERDRRAAARLSLQVARLFAFYEPGATAKIKEAIDRCFALWPAMPDALDLLEQVAEKSGDLRVALTVFSKLASETRDKVAQVDLHLRIGQALLTRLDDGAGACAEFEQAARLDPTRPDAAELASELLIGSGRLPEGVAVLEKHLATLKDRTAQVALRVTLADLAARLLKDEAVARGHLEAAIQTDPHNAHVAWRLLKTFVASNDLERAWPMFELGISAPQAVGQRVELCEAVAQLCESASDVKRAFHALSCALPLEPGRPSLLTALRDAATRSNQQSEFALALRRSAQVAPPPAQEGLWRALGSLLQSLDRPAEAQEAWLEVQKRHGDDAEAIAALAVIRKQLAEEPQDPRSKLEAEARRLEASAADPSSAAAVYRKILELDADSVPTLKKLGTAAANLGQWEEVATVAERLMALADSAPERQEWRARLAQLFSERLGRKDEAVRLYLNLLEEGVENATVVGGLERLASQAVRPTDISRALAPVYARAGDFQRQVASLLVQLNAAQERDELKALLTLLAETTEKRLLDLRGAFDFRLRGLRLDPLDGAFRVESARLSRELKVQQDLARALCELSTKVTETAPAVAMLVDASQLATEARAPEVALNALKTALGRAPASADLLGRLAALARATGRLPEASDALRTLSTLLTGDEQRVVFLQLSEVNAELSRPKEAAASLLEAIRLGAPELEHLPRVAALLEQAGQMQELTEVQARLISSYEQAGERDRAAALSLARARVLETALGHKAEAIIRYAEVLKARPSDADAIASLENLLTDDTHREAAARAVLSAYEHASDHRKQVSALHVIAEAARDVGDRVAALRRAAEVHTMHLRQPEQAFASFAQAVRLTPDDASLRQATRQAAEDADAVDSYAEVLQELVDTGGAGASAIALHRELAELYEKKLNAQDRAVQQLHKVLALDERNHDALRSLQRLHRAREEWWDLVPITERLATLEPEAQARTALEREAALLSESKLNDLDRAALNWRQVVARDVLDRDAASALDRLYLTLDRPNELAFALELRRNQEGQSPQGRELAFRLGQLRQHKLSDLRGALEVYRQILAEDASHEGARGALEQWVRSNAPEAAVAMEILDPVLARTGDHQARIALRDARLASASSRTERARLSSEVRAILERDLSQPEAAFMNALKAFTEGLDRAEVQPELERLARATGSFGELAEIYESASEEVDQPDERAGLVRRAAEIREQLDELDDAVRLWNALLALVPHDRQALEALSKLYARSQNARELSQVYAQQAQLAADPAEKHELLTRAGAAFATAGDDEKAIDAYRSALSMRRTVPVLSALDQLFGKRERHAEQADVLSLLAEESADASEKAAFLLRRGQLLEREGQPADALRAYGDVLVLAPREAHAIAGLERLVQLDAAKVEAARLLEPVYRAASDLKRLVEVLDIKLSVAEPARRLGVLLEVATLREAVGQKSLALSTRLRSFSEAPTDDEVRSELERLVADLGAFEELAAAYEDALERGTDEPLAGVLWRRLASIYGERLSRFDLAANAWTQCLERNPADAFVLEALAQIYRRTSQFRELSVVMRRQLALEAQVPAQVNLLFELATLAEETLSDKSLAATAYQAILERKPDDANALKLLGRLCSEMEKWPELAGVLTREVHLAEAAGQEEEARELLVRLGRLKLTRLGDPRGALNTYQEVLRRKPGHAGAVGALEEMARSDNPLKGEAASTLEPVFAGEGEHLKLVQMIEAQVTSEPQPHERAALLRKMSEIYSQQMDNAEMAFVAATRALRELPDEPKNLALCLLLYKAADAREEFSTLLSEIAPRAADDTARANLYRALAKLQSDAKEPEEAIESWKQVVALAPTDGDAMAQLGTLLADQGRSPELIEVLKRQLTIEEDTPRRVALLFQMGVLQDEQLNDAASALTTFRRLIELSPNDANALARMDALCEDQQRWPELADVLARRASIVAPEERAALVLKLAVVRETRLLDKSGAIELYGELLAANPRHPGALQRLEAIAQKEPQNQAAFEALAKAYRDGTDPVKLSTLIEARVGVSPDVVEKKTLLQELAQIRDAQSEPELAYLAFYRAFKEDPNDAALRRRLEQAAQAAGSWDELASAYEAELPRISEPAEAAKISLTIGQLHEQRLKDAAQAVVFYEKARELDPAVSVRALTSLDKLYGQLNRADKQAEVIEALGAVTVEPAEKVALYFRLGQLAVDTLEKPDLAAVAFEKVLENDPKHLPSLRSLEQLYDQAQMSEKLYRVLEAQRDLVQGNERERVLGKMAVTSAEGLSNVEHSITLYRELLNKNPRNEQAFEALNTLLDKANRADELVELLVARLQVTVDPRELVRLNERVGRVLFERLAKPEDAIGYFKAALDRDARHRGALESLRDIFEALGRKDDLVIILRRLIPLQEEATGVKSIRIRLAEIIAGSARREEALDAARRALEVEPHRHDELERLLTVFTALKAWPDAVRTLEAKVQHALMIEEREQATTVLFQIAELWRGPAAKPDLAAAPLERILEIDPANRQAYEQALELASKQGEWRTYAQVMDRFLPHLTDEEKVATLQQLGRVQESRLGQKDVAFLQYTRALQLNPADDAVREQVERLAEETGSFEELAAVYEEVADDVPRGPLAERLYLTLAQVQDQKLDDADAAEAALRKILAFDPTNEAALERLSSMFARRGSHKAYVVSLEQKLEAAATLDARKAILREIARAHDESLGSPEDAENALQRALQIEPDQQTLEVLVALQRRQGNHAAVASSLLRLRDIAPTPEERSRVQVEVAQVYERDLRDDEAAIEGFRQALEFDPANFPALEALEKLYSRLDRPAELLSVYERELELTSDYRERVKLLFKSASIWEERYQNLLNADACIDAALQVDPQNLQAIKTLERLRKAQGRWDELIGVVDRHINLLNSPEEKAVLCVEMGDIFHQQLKAVDRAVVAYHQALDLDAKCRPAMHALGTLYERSGNWPFALDMLEREAQVLGATPEAVELYFRAGKINEDMLIDASSAKRCYLESLRIDPAYLPAIRSLKGIYEIEKDWENYEKALLEEARQTEDPQERCEAFLSVARYYEQREDRDQATRNYEEALKLVPDSLEAARPLADIYLSTESWERCEKMLDIVTAKLSQRYANASDDDELAKELCRRFYRLGYVSEKNGRRDKSLNAFEKAYQLDATNLAVLEGYGNLLVQVKRFEEALKVYQSILLHHRGDLTDLEVAEIHWTLGDLHQQVKQFDRAENQFEKALAIDQNHEPSLRSMVQIAEATQNFERAADFRQKLLQVVEGEARFENGVALGKLARDKLNDPYLSIDAWLAAHKVKPDALEVMDALYVLYRETKQGAKAAEMLERMLQTDALMADAQRGKRVWFALGEISRDELLDLDKATAAFNAALDLDWHFIEAFSALEAMLGRNKKWKTLDDNYKRMLARFPKTDDTHLARMTIWRALGDMYLNVMKAPDAAVAVYKVVAAGQPENIEVQEQFAALAQTQAGYEQDAVDAWRRSLPTTNSPGKVASALAELAARRKDYDSAYLAAQVVAGLIGEVGTGEREILTKLTPYAKKREAAQRSLTDRLWQQHLFHPRIRGPMSELMAILFEQAGALYKEEFTRYGITPKRHLIDVSQGAEFHLSHYRYVSRLLGMEQIALYSPYLVSTRDRIAKKTTEPAPDPMVGVEVIHTDPVGVRVGFKFFNEAGQREAYYLLGRTMALLRPELALTARLSAERLEAVLQAAISLSVDRFRFTADLRAIDTERKLLERSLSEQARAALARVTKEYVRVATPNDLRNYLEGAELTAVRAGAFVAGEIEPVKRMVIAETGTAYRVQPRSKIRDLMVFALGDDLHALRVAVGTSVEVQVRK